MKHDELEQFIAEAKKLSRYGGLTSDKTKYGELKKKLSISLATAIHELEKMVKVIEVGDSLIETFDKTDPGLLEWRQSLKTLRLTE